MTWTSQHLLNAVVLAAPEDCITEARMVELTGLTEKCVENCARRLRKAGFLYREDRDCYRLTVAGHEAVRAGARIVSGPKGPQQSGQRGRDPGLRQRVWNVLRMGRKVTLDDILLLVLQGGERDPASNVGKYLRALARAGYAHRYAMRETPGRLTSNGAIRWLLVRDTGPLAPLLKRTGDRLYDRNTEAIVDLAPLAPIDKRRRS